MKKKCLFKVLWWILKVIGIAYLLVFLVYYFDLDGKLLYHFVEPNMDAHFSKMERPDLTGTPYGPKEPVES
ncbi:MAG: hypothetical protein II882_00120 [Lachnospiraceae bacterium]|nr:hypothetical protein [Lachnospiraceae bacterium]